MGHYKLTCIEWVLLNCWLISSELHPCIGKTEDLKSTSKLKHTMSSFLSFLSAHYYVLYVELVLFRLYSIQRMGGEEGKSKSVLQSPKWFGIWNCALNWLLLERRGWLCKALLCSFVCPMFGFFVCSEWCPHCSAEAFYSCWNGPCSDGKKSV